MKKIFTILFVVLFCFLSLSIFASRVTKHKEIEFGKITYLDRKGSAWAKTGRIVGELENPPDSLSIEFYSVSQGKILYTYTAPGQLNIYISKFLPPGTYNVTFKASGYHDNTMRKVKVVKGKDCMLNVKFGTRVFTNR